MGKFKYNQKSQNANTTNNLKISKLKNPEQPNTDDIPYPTRIKESYSEFLNRYNWDAFVTLEYPKPVGRETAVKMALGFLHEIRRSYSQLKFAGILHIVHPEKEKPHIHILLISDHKYPINLLTVHESEVERLWPYQYVSGVRSRGCTFHNSFTVSVLFQTDQEKKGVSLRRP